MSNKQKQAPRGPMGGGPSMDGEKAKNFKGALVRLIKYFKPYKFQTIFIVIFAVLSVVFTVIGPNILGEVTTELAVGFRKMVMGSGGIDFAKVNQIILSLIVVYVLSQFFVLAVNVVAAKVSQKIVYTLREQVTLKINKLPFNYFDTKSIGDILSAITNDIDNISNSMQQSVTQLIIAVATILGILIMMLSISIWLTLIALVTLPLSFVFINIIVKKSQPQFLARQDMLAKINGHVEEMYTGHNVVKVFNHENEAIEILDEQNELLYEASWKSQFMSSIMMPVITVINNIGYVGVSVLGAIFVLNGNLQIGQIQAFMQYMNRFTMPVSQTATISNILQQMVASAERVFEILDEQEVVKEASNPIKLENPKGNVSFEHVKFGYKSDKILINDFNLNVKAGKTVAIVGPTGAGKTTIVNLLMRFYELNSGSIKIDGVDITDMTRNDLHSLFGMVLQDTWLFKGSIADNIAYGKLGVSREEIEKAAKLACCDHFIKTLSDGYDEQLNEEGTNVSQGQRQLLTIARAVISDPTILILDEATSSVDTRTEILIQKAMNNLMQGRTSFVIAHRLSTIRDADLILVLKNGDIIEQGNHASLLEDKGFYYNLYNSQFSKQGGFVEEE